MDRLIDIAAKTLPFLVIIAAIVLAALWSLEPVRLWVLTELGERDLQRVEVALDDPSERVAARACVHLLQNGEGSPPPGMMEVLAQRPTVAFDCLEQVAAVSHKDELVPRHELVAAALGKHWMANLIEGKAKSCQTAQNARRAMEHARLDPTYRLTSCAIAADSEEVRRCCVDELGGPEAFAQVLDRPDNVPLRQALDDYAALVGASFPSVPIASATPESAGDESSKEDSEEDSEEASKEDSEEDKQDTAPDRFGDNQSSVQDWVVEVGCRLHFSDPSSRQAVESFVPLIESEGCAPSDPPWQGYYSELSWSAMCTGMYTYRRVELDMSPREAMCDSLERASLAQAATATQLSVAAAIGVASQVGGVSGSDLMVTDPGRRSSSGRSIFGRTRSGMERSKSHSRNTKILNSFIGHIVGP